MKTPEEMLKLSNMIPEKEWKSKLGPGFIAVKHDNGEALLDIAELVFDKETIEEALTRSLFIAASREFVPYAAKRLIEAENLLKEIEFAKGNVLKYCPACGQTITFGHLDNCKIKQFLESSHETK